MQGRGMLTGGLALALLVGVAAAENSIGTVGGEGGPWRLLVQSTGEPRIAHLSWPKLVTTTDGTLILAYSAGVGHNQGGSGPAVSVSRDGGRTFSPPRLLCYFPEDDKRYKDCGNLALGIAGDGAAVLLAMAFSGDKRNTIFGWRSRDDGATWDRVDTSRIADNRTGSVYGHILDVPGEGLVVFGHYRKPGPPSSGIWMSTSTDDGRTWGPPRTVTDRRYFEPAVVFCQGRLIGLFRLPGDAERRYDLAVSDDLGATWEIRPSGIALTEGRPGRQPSPFIMVSPEMPGTLHALQSIRGPLDDTGGRIYLWSAELDRLVWRRERCVIRIPAREERFADWSYPWMTRLHDGGWLLAFYAGAKHGGSSIYGLNLVLGSPAQPSE